MKDEVTLGEYRKFIRKSGYLPGHKCDVYRAAAKWFINPARLPSLWG